MANGISLNHPRRRRASSPSFSSRSSRQSEMDPRLGAAARCLQEMLREPKSLGTRRRTTRFARGVEQIRAELVPIVTQEALVDSFRREANQNDVVEAAYTVRWIELTSGSARPAWNALISR